MNLNTRTWKLVEAACESAADLRIARHEIHGATVLDFGVEQHGGLHAGLRLAELCMAGLGQVSLQSGRANVWPGADICVATDHPVAACMGAQYAGWSLSVDYQSESGKPKNYFAMASGPMRAARGGEAVLELLGGGESSATVVGVLETNKLPPPEVIEEISRACSAPPAGVALAVARTASVAGCVQVVARSVETALHKLHELGFDLHRVRSGFGVAPLPPVAENDLAGIGRTNDAVLYGGEVTLWVEGDDASIEAIGPQTPSSASRDFGAPFGDVFRQYNYDFYQVDPMLFSPAAITFYNVDSGRSFRYGELRPEIIEASFRG